MNTAMTLLPPLLLLTGAVGWLFGIAPRLEGRARVLLSLMIAVFALVTATLGFGVGGIGAPFPGWQQVGQLSKALFYGASAFLLLVQYLRRGAVSWGAWSGLVLYGVALVVAGRFGTQPGYAEGLLFPVVIGVIGALGAQYVGRVRLLRAIRVCLMWICAGSLVYFAAAPALATSNPDAASYAQGYAPTAYEGSVIGLQLRLHGLTPHGNSLGYLAAVALLLGLMPALRMRGERWWQLAALACLVLAQSKTMWVAVVVALAVRQLAHLPGLPPIKRGLTGAALLAVVGAGLTGLLLYAPAIEPADITLTGRTNVWTMTLAEFQANPVAGYGPGLWDEAYRNSYNLPWVGQAHNQAVQTLGQAGLIGGLALLTLVVGLCRSAWMSHWATNGASIALVVVLLLRAVSETPLRFGLDTGALIVLATYLMATTKAETR